MAEEKTLEELARLAGGRVRGNGSRVIRGARGIEDAGPDDITFIAGPKYLKALKHSEAGAVIVKEEKNVPEGMDLLVAENPQLAFAKALEVLWPAGLPPPGIDPRAAVHQGASVGRDVSIQAFSVVEDGAKVGGRVVVYPGVYIGKNAEVGDGTVLYSGVQVREGCRIGKGVVIHCNTVVGSDGFGYAKDGTSYYKIPQRGIVRIGDDVEIGACCTIDRATTGETVIGRGTKIDNLVQIAHNVKVGEDTVIVAQVGISGSTEVGSRVTIAGQVGTVGHIKIGDDSMVGAQSGVAQSIPEKGVFSGSPAIPHGDWLRAQSIYSKLPELKKRIDELEKRLKELEK